jgi:hypothetical protein
MFFIFPFHLEDLRSPCHNLESSTVKVSTIQAVYLCDSATELLSLLWKCLEWFSRMPKTENHAQKYMLLSVWRRLFIPLETSLRFTDTKNTLLQQWNINLFIISLFSYFFLIPFFFFVFALFSISKNMKKYS